MTKAELRKYFMDLRKRFPLNVKLGITLNFPKFLVYKDRQIRGIVIYNNKYARIHVATNYNKFLIIKAIAHEYRHLIQRFNMNWESKLESDPQKERDANLFGEQELRRLGAYGADAMKFNDISPWNKIEK